MTGDEIVHRYPGDPVPIIDALMAAVATPGLLAPLRSGTRLLAEATLIDSVPLAAIRHDEAPQRVVGILAGMPLDGHASSRLTTWRAVGTRSLEVNLAQDAVPCHPGVGSGNLVAARLSGGSGRAHGPCADLGQGAVRHGNQCARPRRSALLCVDHTITPARVSVVALPENINERRPPPRTTRRRGSDAMKLGLFLTPGAARTAFQVGAVEALVEEGGLRFDVVAASSVGAPNGAFAATGQARLLSELWATWRDRDIFGIDFRALLTGAVLWAPNLMHNRPQRAKVIDRYLANVAIPGGRVSASTSPISPPAGPRSLNGPAPRYHFPMESTRRSWCPPRIKPHDRDGMQYADGLTIDGFALEALLLETGVDRAFVVGVTPQAARPKAPRGPISTLLAAAEWNQYTETTRGLDASHVINERADRWAEAHRLTRDAVERSVSEHEEREQLLRAVDAAFDRHRDGRRPPVEVITILPDRHTKMFFTSYKPERTCELLEAGRRAARAVLANLTD